MRAVFVRALKLFQRPWVALFSLLIVGSTSWMVSLPLMGQPGYELSACLTLVIGLLGGGVGIAAIRQEQGLLHAQLSQAEGDRSRTRSGAIARAVGAALLVNLVWALPALLIALATSVLFSPCDPMQAIEFVPILVVPTALLASAVGVWCGIVAHGPKRAFGLYVVLLFGSLGWTAWPIYFGPQVFAFNHFLGFVPGPLYDEVLKVTPALLWFRLETLLWFAFFLFLTIFLATPDLLRFRLRQLPAAGLVLLTLVGVSLAGLEAYAPQLGTRMNHATLQARLGAQKQTEHFILYFPKGKPALDVERWARDLEFRHHEIEQFLSIQVDSPLTVYLYPSASIKRSWVGASETQFAKPWLREIHLNEATFPHPVLRHELVHIMASAIGRGPFRVSAWQGLWPHMGIIEGVAVAVEETVDDMLLHQWAAGMKKEKLLPNIREIVGPRGFYTAAPSRAYTAAGSFFRYLIEQRGTAPLHQLYATGNFQLAYGNSLNELANEWEQFLDQTPVSQAQQHSAQARFRKGSLLARACAREVAALSEEAAALFSVDPDQAELKYRRCLDLQPDDLSFLFAQVDLSLHTQNWQKARALLERAQIAEPLSVNEQIRLQMAWAHLAYAAKEATQAKHHLKEALQLQPRGALERNLQMKLLAVEDPIAGGAIWNFLQPGTDELKLYELTEALRRAPQNAALHYLVGRWLWSKGATSQAWAHLQPPLESSLPLSLRQEAWKMSVELLYKMGDCARVKELSRRPADNQEALSSFGKAWNKRCEFELQVYKQPLAPQP